MGRHRTNPLFNGHGGHIAPPPQSQFDMGPKSFVKSNQVSLLTVVIHFCFLTAPFTTPEVTVQKSDPVCQFDFLQVQNQHFLNQNQNHMAQQQVQSKDMPPRFSKKGQLNADEVTGTNCLWVAKFGQKLISMDNYWKVRTSSLSQIRCNHTSIIGCFMQSSMPVFKSSCPVIIKQTRYSEEQPATSLSSTSHSILDLSYLSLLHSSSCLQTGSWPTDCKCRMRAWI